MAVPFDSIGLLTLIAALLRRAGVAPSGGGAGGGLTAPMPPPGVLEEPVPFPTIAPSSGLPPFPSGWVYYQPPPHAVVVRAWQLLKDLWSQGEGAIKQEQTEGVWVTYRAERMADAQGKLTVMGVTAWRIRPAGAAAASPVASAAPRPSLPVIPASYAQPSPRSPAMPSPVAPLSVTLPPLPASYVQPKAPPAPAVLSPTQIQIALNAAGAMPPLTVDGKIGPKSIAAIRSFQNTHPPLVVDGKAGPLTQTALAPYLRLA